MDLTAKVRDIVAQQLCVDETSVTGNADFVEELGADSLDLIELVMLVEEEFDLEIPDEEGEKLKNLDTLVKYIERHAKTVKH